jgi:HD-GYP domain-containing protein (c-di-GMP phosphodiesterase class II)
MSDEDQLHTISIGPGVSSDLIEEWSEALERKDPGTWSHCQRVAAFAKILAQALGLDDAEIRVIVDGALLHEIGKVAIPEAILRKPAKLSPEEMLVMRGSCS